MNIREAREKAISDKIKYGTIRANELWHAVYYVADSGTIKALADVLEVEHKAQEIKRAYKKQQ